MSRVVVLGHVDCGKSTLLGHMCKQLSEQGQPLLLPYSPRSQVHEPSAWATLRQRAEELGKGSFRYAWAFDSRRDERERGLTIHNNRMCEVLGTELTLMDTPGGASTRAFLPHSSRRNRAQRVLAQPGHCSVAGHRGVVGGER